MKRIKISRGWLAPTLFQFKTWLVICFVAVPFVSTSQVIDIIDARLMPLGDTVTIQGIITSGNEFGTIRYMQDSTAGMAIFSPSLSTVSRGDNITVTGVLSQYQNLLELSPVIAYTVNSQNNPLPAPAEIPLFAMNESYESQLVKIDLASFLAPGTFQGNTTYDIISDGDTGVVFIRSSNPLVGYNIPLNATNLIGINSQFANDYQLLPRDSNDLIPGAALNFLQLPQVSNITTSGMDISWEIDQQCNSWLNYGHTPLLELGVQTAPGTGPGFNVSLSGAAPAQLFYVQAVAATATDTVYTPVKVFITASQSSGTIKAYFNGAVDNIWAYPSGNFATQLPGTFADTIAAYIDRATETLDIAIYNFDSNNTGAIIQAINAAYNRGVVVRIIAEGGNANNGLPLLNGAIPVLMSPDTLSYYGIMHNKFMIIDANAADPDLSVVLSGSTNWTSDQLNVDRNNMVFITDQSLAKVYTMEFEEMWGGSGSQPMPQNAKFGPDKTDNTPHEILVGGKLVESYFSPSDNTNYHISKTIATADFQLSFALLVFTRYDLAYGISDRFNTGNLSFSAGIVDDTSNGGGIAFQILNNPVLFDVYNHSIHLGILHHKYLIVDYIAPNVDGLVLTGSHNWSNSANLRNDENTLVIHDYNIANQYWQEFHNLFNTNGNTLGVEMPPAGEQLLVFPNPTSSDCYIRIPESGNEIQELKIYSMEGALAFSKRVAKGEGLHLNARELNLQAGFYFVQLHTGTGIQSVKLVVVKD